MLLIYLRKTTQCALSESECAAKKPVINKCKAMNDFITANDHPQSATKLGEHCAAHKTKARKCLSILNYQCGLHLVLKIQIVSFFVNDYFKTQVFWVVHLAAGHAPISLAPDMECIVLRMAAQRDGSK